MTITSRWSRNYFMPTNFLLLEKRCVCDIKIPGLIYYEKVDQTSLLQDKYFYFVKLGANVRLLVVIDVGPGPSIGLVYCVNQPFTIKVSRHSTGTSSTILKPVNAEEKYEDESQHFLTHNFLVIFQKKAI